MRQLAEVLGHELGHAVDVLRPWGHFLGDPDSRGRAARLGCKAECACRTDIHEARDARGSRGLDQIERSRHVRIDEVLPAMSYHMRLMQRRGVNHAGRLPHATLDELTLADRTHVVGKWR